MCQISPVAIALQGMFMMGVMATYTVLSSRVIEICLNNRLIDVLTTVRTGGVVTVVGSICCRASLLLPDLESQVCKQQ